MYTHVLNLLENSLKNKTYIEIILQEEDHVFPTIFRANPRIWFCFHRIGQTTWTSLVKFHAWMAFGKTRLPNPWRLGCILENKLMQHGVWSWMVWMWVRIYILCLCIVWIYIYIYYTHVFRDIISSPQELVFHIFCTYKQSRTSTLG